MSFIPDPIAVQQQAIPFFEDSQDKAIPGRGTQKSIDTLQKELVGILARLGASLVMFTPGKYPDGPRVRYGFQVTFAYGEGRGRIDCAALPMRKETPARKDRALAQALYLLRDELQAQVWSSVHKPGSVPLLPYLLGSNGMTVMEHLVATQQVPQLGPGMS